jgi:hypothetical protein
MGSLILPAEELRQRRRLRRLRILDGLLLGTRIFRRPRTQLRASLTRGSRPGLTRGPHLSPCILQSTNAPVPFCGPDRRTILRIDLCRTLPRGLRPLGSRRLSRLSRCGLRRLSGILVPGPGLKLPEQGLGRLAGLRLWPAGRFSSGSSHVLARIRRGLLRSLLRGALRRVLADRHVSCGRRGRLNVRGRLTRERRLNVGGGLDRCRLLRVVRLRRRYVDRRRRHGRKARQRVGKGHNPGTDCRYRQNQESGFEQSRRTLLCSCIGAFDEKEWQRVMVRSGAVFHEHRGMPPLIVLVGEHPVLLVRRDWGKRVI